MNDPIPSLPSPHRKTSSTSNFSSPPSAGGGGGVLASSISPPPPHIQQPSASQQPQPPPSTASSTAINPRSCITCRRRKVKCDKRSPCSNCARVNVTCTFPSPGRAPRRNRRPPDNELLARLRKLEGVVEELSGGVEDGESSTGKATKANSRASPAQQSQPRQHRDLSREMGRLVVDEGKSRYVSTSFWTSLSDEVKGMQDILDESEEEDDDMPSPDTGSPSSSGGHNEFIFGFNSTNTRIRQYHPPLAQIDFFWQTWVRNVDPMVKILHKPTTEKAVFEAKNNLDGMSRSMEALMFAIYLAAVTSISAQEYREVTGESKEPAVARYRFATEQALARASFLTTHELTTLQAFVIFLVVVRRHDQTRFTWTLTGLATRIAQSLGLHRDGEAFGLPPFVTEMRRRLWWHVLSLDIRSSQDHGSDPSITEATFDTKLPMNINDDQMSPDSEEPLTNVVGCTEMTFCLIRYEVTGAMRKLNYNPPGVSDHAGREATIRDKEQWIEEVHTRINQNYLNHCDMEVPLYWVTATVARLIMAKMWLMLHHPFQRQRDGAALADETKDRLFEVSMEVIEYARRLETERRTLQWGWLLRTYAQWHAVVFLLAELCVRTKGELVDRAWRAVDGVVENWGEQAQATKKDMLWRLIKRLMARAKQARENELARQRAISTLESSSLNGMGQYQSNSLASLLPQSSAPTRITPGVVASQGPVMPPNHSGNSQVPIPQTGSSYLLPESHDFSQPALEPGVNNVPFAPTRSMEPQQTLPWAYEEPMLPLNRNQPLPTDSNTNLAAGPMNWEGWDEMVRDFQMGYDQNNASQQGPTLEGMGSWW